MNNNEKLIQCEIFVKSLHENESSGHDFNHINRVRKLALTIAPTVNADPFITEMAALLHDTVDEKLFNETNAWERLNQFMNDIQLSDEEQMEITHILQFISFKGGANKGKLKSLEGKVVQDADRLDALGAIGIARTFMFAGKFNEAMYDENILVRDDEALKKNYREKSTAINHFYEKLFKLKSELNTDKAKEIAEERETYMKAFIDQFMKEWNGNLKDKKYK